MHAPLNAERASASYEFLRAWPPFNRWGLPPLEAITFIVSGRRDCDAQFDPRALSITVSSAMNWHLSTILMSMAHEMIHLHQHLRGTDNRYQHNAEFKRLARAVCQRYAWDFGQFVGG